MGSEEQRDLVVPKEDQVEDLESLHGELKGNTLLMYWFMLRENRPHSAREIQRRVGLSSSSLSLHHLNKLIDLGLVRTDAEGRYLVARVIRPGLLNLFIGTGRLFVPRFIFYAVFNTGLLISSLYLFWPPADAASFILVLSLLVSSFVFWAESVKIWRAQPL